MNCNGLYTLSATLKNTIISKLLLHFFVLFCFCLFGLNIQYITVEFRIKICA